MKRFLSFRNCIVLALLMAVGGLLAVLLWSGRATMPTNRVALADSPGYLGITYVDVTYHMAMSRNMPCFDGALITAVAPRSPAEAAGLLPGDVIVSLDDQSVGVSCPLLQSLLARKAGEQVTLTIQRHDQLVAIPVTLSRR